MTQEALKLALEALENAEYGDYDKKELNEAITAIKEALREHAMREVQRLGQEIEQEPVADAYTFAEMRFVVCPNCGNKRCPKANDHRNACTNSNEVGQKGSSWEHVKPLAQPEQDHIPDARKMVTEQEPVAHCEAGPEYCPVCNTELNQEPAIYPEEAYEMGLEEIAFYTAPPQRTWVGLTESDRRLINFEWQDGNGTATEIIDLVEAKLKEKNT